MLSQDTSRNPGHRACVTSGVRPVASPVSGCLWLLGSDQTLLEVVVLGTFLTLRSIVSGSIFAWRWSFPLQAVNMRDQFRFCGPATEVETQHLIRPLGWGVSDPQADQ